MTEGYRRSCGMDIHKDTVVVCVLPAMGTDGEKARKTFGTFRNDLIRMRVWLKQLKVSEIAMESTGVYWRPVWNVLEEQGFLFVAGESCSGQGSGRAQERWT
jgi:transposase